MVGAVLPVSAMTEKDRRDLAFALELGADWIALSFVQRPEDLDEVRELAGRPVAVMTKLEKPSAVEQLEAIVARSDAVMVARGDLGVEMPPQKVPTIQRRVLRACRKAGKPVIVATQMLESMIEAPTPTRAEASDVATAVYDGADAVMLSAESAAGRYPVEAVRIMSEIIAEVERDPHYRTATDAAHPRTGGDGVGRDLRRLAPQRRDPARGCARHLYGLGHDRAPGGARAPGRADPEPDARPGRRRAGLPWSGARMRCTSRSSGACPRSWTTPARSLSREGLAKPGDTITITGGMPFGVAGTTNLLRVAQVPEGPARA